MALDAESGEVSKNGLPAQVEYLRSIAASLNSGQFASRTPPGVFESTTIPVQWNDGAANGQLLVPDCAGEQWERIHRDREWNSNWEQAVAEMAGCILFFRATSDHNISAFDWSQHADIMKCLSESQEVPEHLNKLPTQVVLVDWLQCLSTAYRDIHSNGQPLRVAIVLSAWDMVPREQMNSDPSEFLSDNLPLLHDFLSTNTELFRSKSFGVSITGGVLTDEDSAFMEKYLDNDPSNSGYVILARGGKVLKSPDLSLPLAWALGCECPDFQDEESAIS
jgi:hypothetical protein